MLIPYCPSIEDEILGIESVVDYECELEIDRDLSIVDVIVEGKSLLLGNRFSTLLATEVMDMAEDEIRHHGRLWDRIMEELAEDAADREAERADYIREMRRDEAHA